MDDRREKLERLRAEGIEPFPYAYSDRTEIARVREEFGALGPVSPSVTEELLASRR